MTVTNQKDMKILAIKKYPHAILREKCRPVEEIKVAEEKLFENMLLTMHNFKGIGLAAPQVNIPYQLIVADTGERIVRLANPEIIKVKGAERMAEGCLSIPEVNVEITRPFEVVVKGLSEKGKPTEIKAKGLLARVLLHEIDHLKGKLIIDYV